MSLSLLSSSDSDEELLESVTGLSFDPDGCVTFEARYIGYDESRPKSPGEVPTSAIQHFLSEKLARERYRSAGTQTATLISPSWAATSRSERTSAPFGHWLVPAAIHSIAKDRNEAVVSFADMPGEVEVQLDALVTRCPLTVCAFCAAQHDAGK
jgi:hypothetical protein